MTHYLKNAICLYQRTFAATRSHRAVRVVAERASPSEISIFSGSVRFLFARRKSRTRRDSPLAAETIYLGTITPSPRRGGARALKTPPQRIRFAAARDCRPGNCIMHRGRGVTARPASRPGREAPVTVPPQKARHLHSIAPSSGGAARGRAILGVDFWECDCGEDDGVTLRWTMEEGSEWDGDFLLIGVIMNVGFFYCGLRGHDYGSDRAGAA